MLLSLILYESLELKKNNRIKSNLMYQNPVKKNMKKSFAASRPTMNIKFFSLRTTVGKVFFEPLCR